MTIYEVEAFWLIKKEKTVRHTIKSGMVDIAVGTFQWRCVKKVFIVHLILDPQTNIFNDCIHCLYCFQSSQRPFLVDPSSRATEWLKVHLKQNRLEVINQQVRCLSVGQHLNCANNDLDRLEIINQQVKCLSVVQLLHCANNDLKRLEVINQHVRCLSVGQHLNCAT